MIRIWQTRSRRINVDKYSLRGVSRQFIQVCHLFGFIVMMTLMIVRMRMMRLMVQIMSVIPTTHYCQVSPRSTSTTWFKLSWAQKAEGGQIVSNSQIWQKYLPLLLPFSLGSFKLIVIGFQDIISHLSLCAGHLYLVTTCSQSSHTSLPWSIQWVWLWWWWW